MGSTSRPFVPVQPGTRGGDWQHPLPIDRDRQRVTPGPVKTHRTVAGARAPPPSESDVGARPSRPSVQSPSPSPPESRCSGCTAGAGFFLAGWLGRVPVTSRATRAAASRMRAARFAESSPLARRSATSDRSRASAVLARAASPARAAEATAAVSRCSAAAADEDRPLPEPQPASSMGLSRTAQIRSRCPVMASPPSAGLGGPGRVGCLATSPAAVGAAASSPPRRRRAAPRANTRLPVPRGAACRGVIR